MLQHTLKPVHERALKLKALSDENRLQIIHELMVHESSVSQLANILSLKLYNISKHLKILETCGLVAWRKKGNSRLYKISANNKLYLSNNNHILDLGFCMFKFKFRN